MLADVSSILSGEAPVHFADRRLDILDDLESSFYLHLQVTTTSRASWRGSPT